MSITFKADFLHLTVLTRLCDGFPVVFTKHQDNLRKEKNYHGKYFHFFAAGGTTRPAARRGRYTTVRHREVVEGRRVTGVAGGTIAEARTRSRAHASPTRTTSSQRSALRNTGRTAAGSRRTTHAIGSVLARGRRKSRLT